MNKLEKYEASFREVYRTYQRNAKRKNIPFELSQASFKRIAEKNCRYCDASPSISLPHIKKYNGAWAYNSIDRIDNSKGYIFDNVQPCCFLCNKLKSNLEEKDFLDQVCAISSHRKLTDE